MPSKPNLSPILVVDDDEVLAGVLGRVLSRDGFDVYQASTPAQALEIAERTPPRVALLDLCLPDGDGVSLARELHARHADLPLILMTAYPLRLRDTPDLTKPFARVLTKPINLVELRQAVGAALSEPSMNDVSIPETQVESVPAVSAARHAPVASHGSAQPVPVERRGSWRANAVPVVALIVLAGFLAYIAGVPIPGIAAEKTEEKTVAAPPPLGVQLVKTADGKDFVPHTMSVPEEVRRSLGILKGTDEAIAIATPPTSGRPLVLPGSTALDPTRIMRIRARFAPAEVVEIAQVPDKTISKDGQTTFRELRSGDQVKKGDLLAVFYSVDVGSKKNDLIDGLVQLRLDQEILEKSLAHKEAVPEVFLLNAQRNVEADRNTIARALNTLKTWNIPDEDIDAVYKEVDAIAKRGGKRDKTKQDQWARVELKAPDDGTVVERNVSLHEMVVDNTINLFQLARVDRMVVLANASEDDLPTLLQLPTDKRKWMVRTVNTPMGTGLNGTIDEISYLIDVNQHNAVIKGHIDNPGSQLRAGQYVTATIDLPPPSDVVEIPTGAVVDDGRQAVVFVQENPARSEFTMRRVQVTQRFEKTLLVRSLLTEAEQKLSAEDKEAGLLPRQPLRKGERVLTAGVLELKKELDDRESEPKK